MRAVGVVSEALVLPAEFGRWFDVEWVSDDRRGLRLGLWSHQGPRLVLQFGLVWYYRVFDSPRFDALVDLFLHSPHGVVRLVESSFMTEFLQFQDGGAKPDWVAHWAIGGGDRLVEVLCSEAPSIEPVPASPADDALPGALAR